MGLSPTIASPPNPFLGPSPCAAAGLVPRFLLQEALPWQVPMSIPTRSWLRHGQEPCVICFLFIDSARHDAGHGVRV